MLTFVDTTALFCPECGDKLDETAMTESEPSLNDDLLPPPVENTGKEKPDEEDPTVIKPSAGLIEVSIFFYQQVGVSEIQVENLNTKTNFCLPLPSLGS
jgi:hypothetical protein